MLSLGPLADRVFSGVIFDMDGTLIDSTPAVVRAWSTWMREFGLDPEQVGRHHGMPSAQVVRSLLAEDQQVEAIRRIDELELADVDDIVVLPGAAEALRALRSAPNAIATSCTQALAQARIAAAQLVPPSVLVTVNDVRHGKPAPDPFLEAARRLGVDPRECLVVEDAPKGLEAAHAAGCATLAVVTTTAREDLHADAVVDDLSDVVFEPGKDGIRLRLASAGRSSAA